MTDMADVADVARVARVADVARIGCIGALMEIWPNFSVLCQTNKRFGCTTMRRRLSQRNGASSHSRPIFTSSYRNLLSPGLLRTSGADRGVTWRGLPARDFLCRALTCPKDCWRKRESVILHCPLAMPSCRGS